MKLLLPLIIVLLTGCSTKLTVTSEPEGARMSFKGLTKTTPFVLSYANLWGRDLPYVIHKEHYKSQIGEIPSGGGHLNFKLDRVK